MTFKWWFAEAEPSATRWFASGSCHFLRAPFSLLFYVLFYVSIEFVPFYVSGARLVTLSRQQLIVTCEIVPVSPLYTYILYGIYEFARLTAAVINNFKAAITCHSPHHWTPFAYWTFDIEGRNPYFLPSQFFNSFLRKYFQKYSKIFKIRNNVNRRRWCRLFPQVEFSNVNWILSRQFEKFLRLF